MSFVHDVIEHPTSPPAPFRDRTLAPPPPIEPFDGAIENETYPGVHQQSKINPKWYMASRRWQMWHQNKEVKYVAGNDGDQLLEKSADHAIVVHRKTATSSKQLATGSAVFQECNGPDSLLVANC